MPNFDTTSEESVNEEEVLHHKGKVTAAIAKAFAENEFEKYQSAQDKLYQSDFDRLIADTEEMGKVLSCLLRGSLNLRRAGVVHASDAL